MPPVPPGAVSRQWRSGVFRELMGSDRDRGCSFYHLDDLRGDISLPGAVHSVQQALDRYVHETEKSIGIHTYPEDKDNQGDQCQHLPHSYIVVTMTKEGRICFDKEDILVEPEHVSGADDNSGC